MTDPSAPQPDDEQPATETPAERDADHEAGHDDALGGDDDLRAGQIGPDQTRP